jgi:hypothetical protein
MHARRRATHSLLSVVVLTAVFAVSTRGEALLERYQANQAKPGDLHAGDYGAAWRFTVCDSFPNVNYFPAKAE